MTVDQDGKLTIESDNGDTDIQLKPYEWPWHDAKGAELRIGNWTRDMSVTLTREELAEMHEWIGNLLAEYENG